MTVSLKPIAWFAGSIAAIAAAPFTLLAFGFWMASDSWRFEGQGVRYWLFLKGSRLERLGYVAPTTTPAKYTVAIDDGNFPGWTIVEYDSNASPIEVVTAYEQRCIAQGLKIIEVGLSAGSEASLKCEYERYIDAEVFAERSAAGSRTQVTVKVWGRE